MTTQSSLLNSPVCVANRQSVGTSIRASKVSHHWAESWVAVEVRPRSRVKTQAVFLMANKAHEARALHLPLIPTWEAVPLTLRTPSSLSQGSQPPSVQQHPPSVGYPPNLGLVFKNTRAVVYPPPIIGPPPPAIRGTEPRFGGGPAW